MIYADFIRQLRSDHNLSQGSLAHALHCSKQYVSNAERGLCTLSPEKEAALIELLGLSDTQVRTLGRYHNSYKAKVRRDRMKKATAAFKP